MASKDKQDRGLLFCNQHGRPIKDLPEGMLYPDENDGMSNLPSTTVLDSSKNISDSIGVVGQHYTWYTEIRFIY